ncbi:unnamed protein product [Pleuronectes platessa]|uniref:Secreted protein n=1 Tax=Pleuronectes platessa TaxID=8262 RepID=A0A9N7UE50_PLEPL|nr:unnamed protein product [Pleuronectes platessa]
MLLLLFLLLLLPARDSLSSRRLQAHEALETRSPPLAVPTAKAGRQRRPGSSEPTDPLRCRRPDGAPAARTDTSGTQAAARSRILANVGWKFPRCGDVTPPRRREAKASRRANAPGENRRSSTGSAAL